MKPVWLLGVPVYTVDRAQALECAGRFVESGGPHLIVTADASALILARRDPEFRQIVKAASLVTADGIGVVQALRMMGRPIADRVCGADLVVDLSGIAAARGWSIFLLGSAPGVAEAAARELTTRFPTLRIAGCQDGYFKDDEPVVRRISELKPDVLFVAMGMPRQEKWFWQYRDRLGVKLAMGVGGSLDVLSGHVKRAPKIMRDHGLEWLYRIASRPTKATKAALLPVFGVLAFEEMLRRRRLLDIISRRQKK